MKLRQGVVVTAIALLASCTSAVAGPPPTRYADPAGQPGDPCTSADPCDVVTAVNDAPTGGEVILAPGDYYDPDNPMGAPITTPLAPTGGGSYVHGPTGSANGIAFIHMNAPFFSGALNLVPSVGAIQVSDLWIENQAASSSTLNGSADSQQIERVMAFNSGAGSFACTLDSTDVLRDSVCAANGSNGKGLVEAVDDTSTHVYNLRNVTVLGLGTGGVGIYVDTGNESTQTVNATNVISRGSMWDVQTIIATHAASNVNLTNSNFANVDGDGITDPTLQSNQTDAPALFGDYSQAANSPTVDAGLNDPLNGTLALFGNPRVAGLRTDIGADEFQPEPAEPPGDGQGSGTSGSAGGGGGGGAATGAGPLASNAFTFGRTRSRRDGSVDLIVDVPGPGLIRAVDGSPGLTAGASQRRRRRKVAATRPASKRATVAGRVTLRIRPSRAARKALKTRRSVRVRLRVTFTPDGGLARSQSKRITLKRPRRR